MGLGGNLACFTGLVCGIGIVFRACRNGYLYQTRQDDTTCQVPHQVFFSDQFHVYCSVLNYCACHLPYKPGFVLQARRLRGTVIHLSGLPETQRRQTHRGSESTRFLHGLAPDGVYLAPGVTPGAVGSYPTISPLPGKCRAVCFLWHFPFPCPIVRGTPDCPGRPVCGSPDFPLPRALAGGSDCLAGDTSIVHLRVIV